MSSLSDAVDQLMTLTTEIAVEKGEDLEQIGEDVAERMQGVFKGVVQLHALKLRGEDVEELEGVLKARAAQLKSAASETMFQAAQDAVERWLDGAKNIALGVLKAVL